MFRFCSFPAVVSIVAVSVVTLAQMSAADIDAARASSIMPAFLKKKAYTPLLFFKVPLGTMDECEIFSTGFFYLGLLSIDTLCF
jgi:hypothetical protein